MQASRPCPVLGVRGVQSTSPPSLITLTSRRQDRKWTGKNNACPFQIADQTMSPVEPHSCLREGYSCRPSHGSNTVARHGTWSVTECVQSACSDYSPRSPVLAALTQPSTRAIMSCSPMPFIGLCHEASAPSHRPVVAALLTGWSYKTNWIT